MVQALFSSAISRIASRRLGRGKAIERKVEQEVAELYALGFRGADLLTACFGKAVGEFGKYERVEKASGDQVTVAELLEMTRESAFNALLKGFKGDDFTGFAQKFKMTAGY
jgi:putative DNA methylase